ncbi:MAG: hypothetical protein ABIY37_04000 [Devosia sp.]
MVGLSEVFAARYRRLTRRARFAALAAVVCAVLGAGFHVVDFFFAGSAFLLAAWSWGAAGFAARRMAVRLREADRQAAVRALRA